MKAIRAAIGGSRVNAMGSLLLACLAVSGAHAGTITSDTNPSDFNDSANWSSLSQQSPLSWASVTSTNGVGVLAEGEGEVYGYQDDNGWYGQFPDGDYLLYNGCAFGDANCGDITLTFSSPVSGFATLIENDDQEASLSATLTAYDSSDDVLGSEDFTADSTDPAVFIGLTDTDADISSIVISDSTGDFAIDTVDLADSSAAPEPVTSLLMGSALAGFALLRLRRARQ